MVRRSILAALALLGVCIWPRPVGAVVAPANDNLASAAVVAMPGSVAGTTDGATSETGEQLPPAIFGVSTVWYKFVPTQPMVVNITLSSCDQPEMELYVGTTHANLSDIGWGTCFDPIQVAIRPGTEYRLQVFSVDSVAAFTLNITVEPVGSALFNAVTPSRLLDSRSGVGLSGAWSAGQTRRLNVTGVAGIPPDATAVAVNLTAIGGTASGYVSAWPAGQTRPSASILNWAKGGVVPNSTVLKVGTGGAIDIYNSAGSTNFTLDVSGYFGSSGQGMTVRSPARILDSRKSIGLTGAWSAAQTRNLGVAGLAGVPPDASAVVLNLTATSGTASSYATAWPAGSARPTASNLNWRTGQAVANLAIVPLGSGGQISLYNRTGSVHLIADVTGYISPSSTGRFVALKPTRLVDTRTDCIECETLPAPLVAGDTCDLQVATGTPLNRLGCSYPGVGGAPISAAGLFGNVTAIRPTSNTYLVVFPPAGTAAPPASSTLNIASGDVRANGYVSALGYNDIDQAIGYSPYAKKQLRVFNKYGTTNVAVDLFGYII